MVRRTLLSAVTLAVVMAAHLLAPQPHTPPARTPPTMVRRVIDTVPAASRPRALPWYTPPAEQLLFNDPVSRPHATADELVRLCEGTPRGATIEVSTYFLRSVRIEDALSNAFTRGVRVRVILSSGQRQHDGPSDRLARLLDRRGDGSWLHWSSMSTRGTSGIDHQKIYRFSRVGRRRHITVVGSMNSSDISDQVAYSEMLMVSRPGVYDAFAAVFRQSARDRPVTPNPLLTLAGHGWRGYVFPSTAQEPGADPVMRRLDQIPARPGSVLNIAMYSMWNQRGLWIADKLASMASRGVRISLIAGPPFGSGVLGILEAAGIDVRGGCFTDGTYVHSKDMAATYVRGGTVHRWTWIGSDNWTSRSEDNDEAVLGVQSATIQRQFLADFDSIWGRQGSVMPSACHPLRG
ncbi:MAG: phospholipase D-like domain-containing protein [Nocardioidaceae bacterium]|nr:phospholipase D-like domain-containing protein [Nocardioidaceae bacterium]MCL2614068.1 phospholipase D-like domain-containing protein [Nocardioidaceae bacterium]